ncbi:DNA ligase [Paenibacillus aurantius]|uniref:DNA ligase n=1 Tax=Paenibacillus aurantius TaxID=2918900 RepID=A0AA96REQ9_9BACL|nr:DNA ligase [Paenibacillus aurantius]WNQ10453.1 DNA ligase [Paenibacillus aurantius]
MSPILDERLPAGPEWGYQLKWDGVRLLTGLDNGSVQLYSKRQLPKNAVFPELVETLSRVKGRLVLDGEAVVFDPVKGRPVFQKVLQRERLKQPAGIREAIAREPVAYVLFDVLEQNGKDLRDQPFRERHERLLELFPEKKPGLFVTDLFPDGQALWTWVETNGWEGVVSKRLASKYRSGKKHGDWFKKKTALVLDVSIVAYTMKAGVLSSLVMLRDGVYFGRVSLGLDTAKKRELLDYAARLTPGLALWSPLPADLRKETLLWLSVPFPVTVTGLEITEAGQLRHPKLVNPGGIHP